MDHDEPQPHPSSRIFTLPEDDADREPQAPITGRAESSRIFAEE